MMVEPWDEGFLGGVEGGWWVMANYDDILVCTYNKYYLLPRQVVTINMALNSLLFIKLKDNYNI